ncbi:MAG: hypothetical protein DRP74_09120 [Candidatus Omnitrophota bacterium]|nr:MAG: hypothetical protein DRP74_09120 [Candidatus Omnitrophota bacterium]
MMFRKLKNKFAWWLIKDLIREGIPYIKVGKLSVGKNTVDVLEDSIKFPVLSSDPTLEPGKIWYRGDLDQWRYSPDGTNVKSFGGYPPDNAMICLVNGKLTLCENIIIDDYIEDFSTDPVAEGRASFTRSTSLLVWSNPSVIGKIGQYWAGDYAELIFKFNIIQQCSGDIYVRYYASRMAWCKFVIILDDEVLQEQVQPSYGTYEFTFTRSLASGEHTLKLRIEFVDAIYFGTQGKIADMEYVEVKASRGTTMSIKQFHA